MAALQCFEAGRTKEKFGFHMPGHSAGLAFSGAFQSLLLSFDTTELPSTGDLNDPTGAVEETAGRPRNSVVPATPFI